MLHLNKMINLDTGALQTETTGKKIVRKLQEYLFSKMSPDERAILPEDKIQHLLVGVCDLLYSIFQQYAQKKTKKKQLLHQSFTPILYLVIHCRLVTNLSWPLILK